MRDDRVWERDLEVPNPSSENQWKLVIASERKQLHYVMATSISSSSIPLVIYCQNIESKGNKNRKSNFSKCCICWMKQLKHQNRTEIFEVTQLTKQNVYKYKKKKKSFFSLEFSQKPKMGHLGSRKRYYIWSKIWPWNALDGGGDLRQGAGFQWRNRGYRWFVGSKLERERRQASWWWQSWENRWTGHCWRELLSGFWTITRVFITLYNLDFIRTKRKTS